jgi:hypothetical protein
VQNTPTKSDVKKAQEAATAWLTNGKGYKVERRDESGNVIDTLYLDTPDIDQAVNVLRIGQSGIGFSNNGVGGPYYSAWTLDGRFNADFISGGTLSSADGKIQISLVGAEEPIFNTGISTNGLTVRADEVDAPKVFEAKVVEAQTVNGEIIKMPAIYFRTHDDVGVFTINETGAYDENNNFSSRGCELNVTNVNDDATCRIVTTDKSSAFQLRPGTNANTVGRFSYDKETGKVNINTDQINLKSVSWEYSSELEKYVLCGE